MATDQKALSTDALSLAELSQIGIKTCLSAPAVPVGGAAIPKIYCADPTKGRKVPPS
jgi:hypothetical protein